MADNLNTNEDKEKLDTQCKICGRLYHYCNNCREFKTIESWRQHADTMEHYKIFMTILDYTQYNESKDKVKEQLSNCDLSDSASYFPWIQYLINQIMDID